MTNIRYVRELCQHVVHCSVKLNVIAVLGLWHISQRRKVPEWEKVKCIWVFPIPTLISCLKIPETRRTSFRLFDSSFEFSVLVDTHTCQKLIASSLHVATIARCVMWSFCAQVQNKYCQQMALLHVEKSQWPSRVF